MKRSGRRHTSWLNDPLVALWLVGLMCGCSKAPVNGRPWRDYVLDLVDTARVPRLDTGGARLISTYDRTGGNEDHSFFVGPGKESGWVVLADLKGPGCVRRFWTTGMLPDHPLRLFFDGERKPRLSGTLTQLFGGIEPFTPPLAQYLNLCWWSYVPLTFNHSLRVEALAPTRDPAQGIPRKFYVQFNVETYEDGRAVQTFPKRLTEEDQAALTKVRKAWSASLEWPQGRVDDLPATTVSPGTAARVYEAEGPAVLKDWYLDVRPVHAEQWSAAEREYLLQDVIIRVTYDNHDRPSIETPLGDFFCNAWRRRHFGSCYLGSSPEAYWCGWPMPFEQQCRIEVVNGCDRPIAARLKAQKTDSWNDQLGYLHAWWNRSGPEKGTPHEVANIQGRGKFMGCFLGVTGLDDSWWILEGDETMYIDGESTPSWHGTGLEDYFNGGWYYHRAAFAPLHGVMDRNPIRAAQYRFQSIDPVTFSHSFRMSFERGDQNVSQGYFRSTAYAYLADPVAVPSVPEDRAARRAVANPAAEHNTMLILIELERMNNFDKAIDFITEYSEAHPHTEAAAILQLRALEYRRLLGESVADDAFISFRNGEFGPNAQQQAKALQWFYAKPNRALVGLLSNGQGRLYLDGRQILAGDHPLNTFVAGTELAQGEHALAAEVTFTRPYAFVQFALRTHTGVTGTGPGTWLTRSPPASWQSAPVDPTAWDVVTPFMSYRGPPFLPFRDMPPNAFVLLTSKSYPTRALNWDRERGTAYFRTDFMVPLAGWPDFSRQMTGLAR